MNDSSTPSLKTEAGYPDVDPAQRRRSRIKLIAIFAIFAVPLLLATIYLQIVRSSGGQLGDTSRGQLIQPAVPLTDFAFPTSDPVVDLDQVRGLWTLLYMPEGECADTCRLNLYHMRQVRLALNHRMDRVQRIVMPQAADQLAPELLAEHPGLLVATGSAQDQAVLRDQVRAAESAMDALPDAIYLIDPFGNVMLRFPPDLDPKMMLKDIKHLLKVSRIG